MPDHPPLENLRRFVEGLLPPDDMATVAIHVAGCGTCRKHANQEKRSGGAYAGAIGRVASRATEREGSFRGQRRRAASDLAEILALPTEEWNRAVRSSPKYHSYAFARQALVASKAGWTDDPYRSERLAELGLFVADRLSNVENGRRNLSDLRSRAWAYIGNCQRIHNDFSSSSDSLQEAIALHHAGSAAGRDRTKLVSFLRSLVTDTCQHHEAFDLLDEIESLARHFKDQSERGRALWARGVVYVAIRKANHAIPYLERAVRILTNSGDLVSATGVQCELGRALIDSGAPNTARKVLRTISPDDRALLGALNRIRQDWIEALALWKLGNPALAAEELTRCRQELIRRRLSVNASHASLDLSSVWLDLGDRTRAAVAASSALPAFALRGLGDLSLQAIDLYRRAGGLS